MTYLNENELDDEDEDDIYGSPPWPDLGGSGGGNSLVGHDTSRIDAIPTPPPLQQSNSGRPVVQDTYSVFQVASVTNENPNFPPEEEGSTGNNVAQSEMLPDRVRNLGTVGFNKTQCKGCKSKTIRFSQKSCGHVVCEACLPRYEGMPCKICKQPVGGIQQIDASFFA